MNFKRCNEDNIIKLLTTKRSVIGIAMMSMYLKTDSVESSIVDKKRARLWEGNVGLLANDNKNFTPYQLAVVNKVNIQ